jgi:hypothetical protein
MKAKMFNTKRKIAAAGLTAAIVLGTGGVAAAYFTSTGSGNGSATVGTASPWSVTVDAATGGPLLPGSGTESMGYSISHLGGGVQKLNSATASINAATLPAGCEASWFTASAGTPTANLDGSYSGTVTVTMSNVDANQNACQGGDVGVILDAA